MCKQFANLTAPAAVALLTIASAATAARAAYDFIPRIENGKIVTGGYDDGAGANVSSLRVSGYAFGSNPDDPYNLNDPGFNTIGASTFRSGTQLRFQPLPLADNVFLQYWNGTGTPLFATTPQGVSIRLSASPTRHVTYTSTAASVVTSPSSSSLLIGSFSSNGTLHVHFNSSLYFNGSQDPDLSPAPIGAYLLSFKLLNPNTSVTDSDPLYMVYSNGLTTAQQNAAVQAATSALSAPPTLNSPSAPLSVADNRTYANPSGTGLVADLIISPSGSVNLQSSLALRSPDLTRIRSYLASGQLYSSLATPATTLTLFSNNYNGQPYFTSLAGISLLATDYILSYTYVGDFDRDGLLTGADYKAFNEAEMSFRRFSLFDPTFDLNSDSTINTADATLFYANYEKALANPSLYPKLAAGLSSAIAATVIPEPAALSLLAAVGSLLGRARKRHPLH